MRKRRQLLGVYSPQTSAWALGKFRPPDPLNPHPWKNPAGAHVFSEKLLSPRADERLLHTVGPWNAKKNIAGWLMSLLLKGGYIQFDVPRKRRRLRTSDFQSAYAKLL